MTNWHTNLGGAIAVTGTTLLAIGTLSQLSQLEPDAAVLSTKQLHVMWYVALVGFVMVAIGKGLTALFAADAAQVKDLQNQLAKVPDAIDSGDTSQLKKPDNQPVPTDPPKP